MLLPLGDHRELPCLFYKAWRVPGVEEFRVGAVVESFWGHMQTEPLNRQRRNRRVELANGIFEYIEG